MKNREKGNVGEKIAEAFLKRKGYRIVARQWKCKAGEADLIAEDRECLVFVEVKSRRTATFGAPEESITPDKFRKVAQVAEFYLLKNNLGDAHYRIDGVGVILDERAGTVRVRHLEDIAAGAPFARRRGVRW